MPSTSRVPNRSESSPVLVLHTGFSGDDTALVAAVREGRPGAKAEFFNRYAKQVERCLTHILGFERELADVLQETYTNAYAALHSLSEPAALKPWLMGIAARTAYKVLRGRSRRAWLRFFVDDAEEARYAPVAPHADHHLLHAVRAVYAVLDRLPAEERLAFTLRFIEGMDLIEVAAAMSTSLSTAKRRLARAQTRFLACAQDNALLTDWLARGGRWQGQ